MARIAIHGFGRIGRSLMKAALKDALFTPVAVSDIKDLSILAALFEVDTNYGRWHEQVKPDHRGFVIGGRTIAYYNTMNELPDWRRSASTGSSTVMAGRPRAQARSYTAIAVPPRARQRAQ